MPKFLGFVRSIGWETEEQAASYDAEKPRFVAIVEFPDGPPDLPWSVIWDAVPVTIVPQPDTASVRENEG